MPCNQSVSRHLDVHAGSAVFEDNTKALYTITGVHTSSLPTPLQIPYTRSQEINARTY